MISRHEKIFPLSSFRKIILYLKKKLYYLKKVFYILTENLFIYLFYDF